MVFKGLRPDSSKACEREMSIAIRIYMDYGHLYNEKRYATSEKFDSF